MERLAELERRRAGLQLQLKARQALESNTIKARENVRLVMNKELPAGQQPPLPAPPRYMEALTSVTVSCTVGFPMALLDEGKAAIDQAFKGSFRRAIYVFKHKDTPTFKRLFGAVCEINDAVRAEAVAEAEAATQAAAAAAAAAAAKAAAEEEEGGGAAGNPDPEAEAEGAPEPEVVAAVEPDYSRLLTGVQVLDAARRMVFVEGPRATMRALAAKVPRGRANDATFKIFANDGLGFGARLYDQFSRPAPKVPDPCFPTFRTTEKLDALMLRPEVSKTTQHGGGGLSPHAAAGLRRLWAIRRCEYLREVARMGLWPSAEQLEAVNSAFGEPKLCYEDVHGEPKKKVEKRMSALEAMQAAQEVRPPPRRPDGGGSRRRRRRVRVDGGRLSPSLSLSLSLPLSVSLWW
eukprot:COSAG01_NODE_402_length_17510_cov_6.871575_20_plen_406_part_00